MASKRTRRDATPQRVRSAIARCITCRPFAERRAAAPAVECSMLQRKLMSADNYESNEVTLLRPLMRAVLTGVFAGLLLAVVPNLSLAADSATGSRYRVLAQDNGHVAIVNGRGEV